MKIRLIFVLAAFLMSCDKIVTESAPVNESIEMSQQLTDLVGSIDGLSAVSVSRSADLSVKSTTCFSQSFSNCSAGTRAQTYNGCAIGDAVFTGVFLVKWYNTTGTPKASCILTNVGEKIGMGPQTNMFISTGRGYTNKTSKVGTLGNVLTWTAGSGGSRQFSLTSDGLRRVITDAAQDNKVVYDITSTVTSAISVNGAARTNRSISGGNLRFLNNLTNETCDFAPQSIFWADPNCSCPTAGNWVGSCNDGVNSRTINMSYVSPSNPKVCGQGVITVDGSAATVMLDNCYQVGP